MSEPQAAAEPGDSLWPGFRHMEREKGFLTSLINFIKCRELCEVPHVFTLALR